MNYNDLTFFTNEENNTLHDRFNKILNNNVQFFDVLVGYFRRSRNRNKEIYRDCKNRKIRNKSISTSSNSRKSIYNEKRSRKIRRLWKSNNWIK